MQTSSIINGIKLWMNKQCWVINKYVEIKQRTPNQWVKGKIREITKYFVKNENEKWTYQNFMQCS